MLPLSAPGHARQARFFAQAKARHHLQNMRERKGEKGMNAWILLIMAGLCEIGWPLGLKWAQSGAWRVPGAVMAVVCMAVSGLLLFLAQRHIPMGTAYAVWTGIGAAGAFVTGMVLFDEPFSLMRAAAVTLIVSGVVMLKMA